MGKTKSLRILLPDDLHQKAKMKAAKTGTSMAEVCRQALQEWVKEQPAQPEQ